MGPNVHFLAQCVPCEICSKKSNSWKTNRFSDEEGKASRSKVVASIVICVQWARFQMQPPNPLLFVGCALCGSTIQLVFHGKRGGGCYATYVQSTHSLRRDSKAFLLFSCYNISPSINFAIDLFQTNGLVGRRRTVLLIRQSPQKFSLLKSV